jgi:uncharacterized protein with GYD domain
MPKFLCEASYSASGAQGVIKEGGSSRQANLRNAVERLGGRVECFYFAWGTTDVYTIVELPDNVTALALSMTINATGGVKVRTTPLVMPEEVDQAAKKSIQYRSPGA